VSRGALPALAALDVGDPPEVWRRLGFAVSPQSTCVIGDVTLRLLGRPAGEGLLGWELRSARPLPDRLDGIPTRTAPADGRPAAPAAEHPNAVTRLDHVVLTTPDIQRTLAALRAAGLQVRRERDAGTPERPLRQAFLWAGDVLLEVAGPPGAHGPGPARLWGLVAVTEELDDLPSRTDHAVGTVRDAVQEGRRITTVRQEAGSSVPLAFMTPHDRTTTRKQGSA
jgi:hypothetical protein